MREVTYKYGNSERAKNNERNSILSTSNIIFICIELKKLKNNP